MSATYVYVITGPDHVLYVGHTTDLFRRLSEHAREPWAPDVVHVGANVFADKTEALRVERNFIADLEPEFNTQGNPGRWALAEMFGGAA